MLFTASFLSLAAAAVAQTVVNVTVGFTASDPGGIFQFKPNNFNATNGTVINFQFTGAPGNHSVTQAAFNDPCNPLKGGFDSGWVFVPSAPSPVPQWNLTITDASKPIWFFCKQLLPSPHCGAGMVGAINAPTTGNTFAAFQKAAQSAGQNAASVGQGINGLVGVGASASADVGPVASGVTVIALSTTIAGSAPAGTQTAPAPSGSAGGKSGATNVAANSLLALGAAALGFVLV
ncbi:putative GPI-anchored cupredoxin [Psilocybe cubensis]|uniref:GPI-anchored cupredoxin n=2 Tax=Psilocybe cubensis TaxID=181762 RepID=A0ACB8GK45_PSICU|nr:putative GPI-anchored cupredoxin [Psilocybe cubensis]KAH9475586.1 putative GPI-anchored cupredoxin [Psilocybe cubensis]